MSSFGEPDYRLVFFLMDGCPHCDVLKDEGGAISQITDPNLRIVRASDDNTDLEKEVLDLSGTTRFPSIKLVIREADAPPTVLGYEGPRDAPSIVSWAEGRLSEYPEAMRVLLQPLGP